MKEGGQRVIAFDLATPVDTTPGSGRLRRLGALPVALLLIFSAVITVDRLAAPQVPINVDPAFYAVVSHELLLGESLYTDVWDHKPPAIFVAYGAAELLFGYSTITLIYLNILVSLAILLGIYYAGTSGPGGVISGLVAAGLWVVASGSFQLEGRDPNTESFMNACMIWAFALLVNERETSLRTSFVAGVLFLIGSLFKPVMVAMALVVTGVHFVFCEDRRKALKNTLMIALIGVAGWLLMFGYFAVTGRYGAFYESVISYNRAYAGDIAYNMIAPLVGGNRSSLKYLLPLAVFGAVGAAVSFFKDRRKGALLGAYIFASWIAIALPGRFSVHYFQLWLPPLTIGAAWAISRFALVRDWRLRIASFAAAGVLFVILMANEYGEARAVSNGTWKPVVRALNAGDRTAAEINTLLTDDETFFLWGNTPNLYLLTGRRPPTPVLFDTHLKDGPLFQQLSERVRSDMEARRPELLVVEFKRPAVPDWIARDYETEPIYQDDGAYSIYVRRGGRHAASADPDVHQKQVK